MNYEFDENGKFVELYDYYPLLKSFGYEIILKVDDDDYQGDSRVLYKNNNCIGFLIFGWGSCSGCDALQACNSMSEVEELRLSLLHCIKWFISPEKALEYFLDKDWETEYYWHATETKEFVAKAIELLNKIKDEQ